MSEQLTFDLQASPNPLLQLWQPDDIYDRLDDALLRQIGEDRRVERKGCQVQPRALGDNLSMWSNTHPHGGIIIVGVENNGTITGLKNLPDEAINKLEYLSI